MCLQCQVDSETVLNDFIPGWDLQVSRIDNRKWHLGWYGFVQVNDPALVFDTKFVEDPCIGCDDDCECTEEKAEQFIQHIGYASELRISRMHFWDTIYFYESCREAGYDTHVHGYNIESWVLDRIARMLKENHSDRN